MDQQALGNDVWVRVLPPDERTPGGLILQSAESNMGEIVNIGPEVHEKQKLYKPSQRVEAGDFIWLPRGSKLGEQYKVGKEIYILLPFTHCRSKFTSQTSSTTDAQLSATSA